VPLRPGTASCVNGVRLLIGRCNPPARWYRQGRGGRRHAYGCLVGILPMRCMSEQGWAIMRVPSARVSLQANQQQATVHESMLAARPSAGLHPCLILRLCPPCCASLHFRTIEQDTQNVVWLYICTLTQHASQPPTPSFPTQALVSLGTPAGALCRRRWPNASCARPLRTAAARCCSGCT